MKLLGYLVVVIIAVIIYCHMTKNVFWSNRRSDFRYKSYFKPEHYVNALKTTRDRPFKLESFHNMKGNDKIMTVSIYGSHPKYFRGLQKLIDEMVQLPDWTLRVYCHNKCPPHLIQQFTDNTDIETIIVDDPEVAPGNSSGMFWRFMPLSEDVTFITLDADEHNKLLDDPEVLDIWLNSDRPIFRIGESIYPWPKTHLRGSYFGKRKDAFKVDPEYITNFPVRKIFGADEIFLQHLMNPLLSKLKLVTYIPDFTYYQRFIYEFSPKTSELGDYREFDDIIISKINRS